MLESARRPRRSASPRIAMLKTDNAEQGINVSGDRINALPLNFAAARNVARFAVGSASSCSRPRTGQRARERERCARGGFKIYLEGQDITSSNDTLGTSTVAAASVETIGDSRCRRRLRSRVRSGAGGLFISRPSRAPTSSGHIYEYIPTRRSPREPVHRRAADSRKHNYGSAWGPCSRARFYEGATDVLLRHLESFRNKTDSPASRPHCDAGVSERRL